VRPVFETEGGVCREPHNRLVGKSQFSVRVLAGSHDGFLVDDIVQRPLARRAHWVPQLHGIVYSREARFVR